MWDQKGGRLHKVVATPSLKSVSLGKLVIFSKNSRSLSSELAGGQEQERSPFCG